MSERVAALPIREGQVGLITNRSGKNWIIPKGWPEVDLTDPECALQEAWEEMGVDGRISSEPVGSYVDLKYGEPRFILVFLLHVTEIFDEYPEDFRDRIWVDPEEAVQLVKAEGLRDIIREVCEL